MAEAKLDIAGNTDEAQKAVDKLTKKVAELSEAMRTMKGQAKEQHHESHGWMQEQVLDIGRMAIGYLTVEKGIEKVIELYQDWQEELHKTGEAHEQFTSGLMRELAKAGDLANATHIEHFLGNIKGVTRQQGLAAFAGVRGAIPFESLERREQLTKAATGMAPIFGKDYGAMQEFGTGVGAVAKLTPGKDAGDVADITAKLQSVMGDDFGEIGGDKMQRGIDSLIKAGMSPEDAFGVVVTAKRNSSKKGTVDKIFNLMEATKKELRPSPGDTSEEAKAKRKLMNSSGMDRWKMLISDPSMASAFGEGASEWRRLSPHLTGDLGGEFRAAQADDFSVISNQLKGSALGKEFIGSQGLLSQKEEFEKKYGSEQALLEKANQSALSGSRLDGFAARAFEGFSQSLNYSGRAIGVDNAQSQLFLQTHNQYVDPTIKDEIVAYLKEQTEMMRAEKSAKPRNLDAHTE